MASTTQKSGKDSSTAHLGFAARLWLAADQRRNRRDAAKLLAGGVESKLGGMEAASARVQTRRPVP